MTPEPTPELQAARERSFVSDSDRKAMWREIDRLREENANLGAELRLDAGDRKALWREINRLRAERDACQQRCKSRHIEIPEFVESDHTDLPEPLV